MILVFDHLVHQVVYTRQQMKFSLSYIIIRIYFLKNHKNKNGFQFFNKYKFKMLTSQNEELYGFDANILYCLYSWGGVREKKRESQLSLT